MENPIMSLGIHWYALVIPIGVILIATQIFAVIKLRDNRALAERLCFYFLLFVLIYKTFHYVIYCIVLGHDWTQQIPCEISQLSYFICPLAYLSQQKYLKDSGAFMGIFAGGVQLVACMAAPYSFVGSGTLTLISFLETILMHYLILWCGVIQITCIRKLEFKNLWQVYTCVLFVLLWGVLAAFTWRFGTDAGYPNEPANIGFVQRCVLPEAMTKPLLDATGIDITQNHLFIIPYLFVFFIFTAAVYLVSAWSFKNIRKQEPSIYGIGWIGMRRALRAKN